MLFYCLVDWVVLFIEEIFIIVVVVVVVVIDVVLFLGIIFSNEGENLVF